MTCGNAGRAPSRRLSGWGRYPVREAIAKIAEGHEALSSLWFSIEVGPFCVADHVAGRWRCPGYPDGSPVTVVGKDILRGNGEKFVEYWAGSMTVPW